MRSLLKITLVTIFGLAACSSARAATTPEVAKNLTVTIDGVTYYKGYIPKKVEHATYVHPVMTLDVPTTYDAVTDGKATPVKNPGQGSCGDCWAWGRVSSLESASILAGIPSPFVSLSEEDVTVNASDEFGCNGGDMNFNYEMSHGVTSLDACPWGDGTAACAATPVVQGATMLFIGSDTAGPTDAELMAAIYQYGSVAVTVAADGNFNTTAGSDEMADCSATAIDHMVSLVGYRPAKDGGVEYKMKNSWGTSWGADGYAFMKKGCDQIATGPQSAMVITAKAPGK